MTGLKAKVLASEYDSNRVVVAPTCENEVGKTGVCKLKNAPCCLLCETDNCPATR